MQFGLWPPPANLQNQPAESVSGASARTCRNPALSRPPGALSPGATIRSEERGSREPGAASIAAMAHFGACRAPRCGHRLCGIVAGATLLPTTGWPSARTGIFISIVLAWFFAGWGWGCGGRGGTTTLPGRWERRAQVRDSRRNPPRRRAGNRALPLRSSRRASRFEPRRQFYLTWC